MITHIRFPSENFGRVQRFKGLQKPAGADPCLDGEHVKLISQKNQVVRTICPTCFHLDQRLQHALDHIAGQIRRAIETSAFNEYVRVLQVLQSRRRVIVAILLFQKAQGPGLLLRPFPAYGDGRSSMARSTASRTLS